MQTISASLTNSAPRYPSPWNSAIDGAIAIVIDGRLWRAVCAAFTML